jgi:hypothetical protein
MGARDPASNYVAVLSTVFPAPTIFGHFYSHLDTENPLKKMVAFDRKTSTYFSVAATYY